MIEDATWGPKNEIEIINILLATLMSFAARCDRPF
jgi:hypothetical protein